MFRCREILNKKIFKNCEDCPDFILNKLIPLNKQVDINKISDSWKRCSCGKRPLDAVMAHILKIMIDEKDLNKNACLRDVGSPLLTPMYYFEHYPYLPKESLVLLSPHISKETAERIVNEVSEVKGVIKGNISELGNYRLLSGSDARCDIVETPVGCISLFKKQSQIHIELPKKHDPKIVTLYNHMKNLSDFTVLDATCGVGTLGIFSLKMGARRVIFNDIWPPATYMTLKNLEINGFKNGFEIYNLDVLKLIQILKENFDLCILDLFPGTDPKKFIYKMKNCCKEIIVL